MSLKKDFQIMIYIYNIYYVEAQVSLISALLCKWVERGKKEYINDMCSYTRKIIINSKSLITII